MSRQFTHLIADSIVRTIADRLAEGKIGPLEDASHPLTKSVVALSKSVSHRVPPEGQNLWSTLVHHTTNERPLLQVSVTMDDDLVEIKLTASDGDKSSDEALRLAAEFQSWVYRTYVPQSLLEFYVDENVAWFNGDWFEFHDATFGLRVVAHLWEHRDETVPAKVIAKAAFSWEPSGKTIKRRVRDLLPPFADFVTSNKKGWRFSSEELQRYLNRHLN